MQGEQLCTMEQFLKNQSLDSPNIDKGVSFDVTFLPRTYVTIEGVKLVVTYLKNIVVWFMHEKKTDFISRINQKCLCLWRGNYF